MLPPSNQPAQPQPALDVQNADYHSLAPYYGADRQMLSDAVRAQLIDGLRSIRPEQFSISGLQSLSGLRENLLGHVLGGIQIPLNATAHNLPNVLADVNYLRSMLQAATESRFAQIRSAAKHGVLSGDASDFVDGKLKPLLNFLGRLAFDPQAPAQTQAQAHNAIRTLAQLPNDDLAAGAANHLIDMAVRSQNHAARWRVVTEFVVPSVLGQDNRFRFNSFSPAQKTDLFFKTLDALRGTGHDDGMLAMGRRMEPYLPQSIRPFAQQCLRDIEQNRVPVGNNFSYREQVRMQLGV